MIIEQNVKVKDRKSLHTVKAYVKENRDIQRARVFRGSELFAQKWNAERLAKSASKKWIPKALGKSLSALSASLFLNDEEGSKDEKRSSWKRILVETLERFIPKAVNQVLS